MVAGSEIDSEANPSPIRFEPPLTGSFVWKSQTDGEFTPKAVPPGTEFKVFLRKGLTALDKQPLNAADPVATRISEPFTVNVYYFPEDNAGLDRRPSIPMRFSCRVRPADLLKTVWFQDRDSRQRYPIDLVLEQEDTSGPVVSITVTPRGDLPLERTFDLLVDAVPDAATGTRLQNLVVQPLGVTKALKVVRVAAFNYPMQKRRITVEFSEPVNPSEGAKVRIEPKVAGLTCVGHGEELRFEGDFDIARHYSVIVSQEAVGKRGFPLAAESRWGATFHAKKPQIVFPAEDLHQRSSLGLNFGFLQINTGPLVWRLARVPAEKLLAVNERLREFTEKRTNPVTGEPMEDPATGLPLWTKSESLIDASRLETVATGNIDAAPSETETRRDIRWKPANGLPAGAYVLEVTGMLPDGHTLANRGMVVFTEFAATQKEFGDTRLVRVMNVADGRAVPGVRVRTMTDKNAVLAEAVTDASGEVRFSKSALQPKEGIAARWFLLDTPDGPVLQTVDAQRFYGSASWNPSSEEAAASGRIAVNSDRPLYRPGQLMKFKGFVRTVADDGELRIPSGSAQWKIVGGTEDEVTSGTARLDEYGGLEGEWTIPESIHVGQYRLAVSFGESTGDTFLAVQEFRPPPFQVQLTDGKAPGAQGSLWISSAYFHGAPNAGAQVKWQAVWTARSVGDSAVVVTDVPREAPAQRERRQTVHGEGVLNAGGMLEAKCAPPFTDGIPRGWYDVQWTAEVTAADGQTIVESASFPVFAVPVELSVTAAQVSRNPEDRSLAVAASVDAVGPDQKPVAGAPVSVELYRVGYKTAKEQISPNVYRYRNSVSYEKLRTVKGKTPFKQDLAVPAAGEYLVVARHAEIADVPAGSSRATVAGIGESEFPVANEDSIGVSCDRPAGVSHAGIVPVADAKNAYTVGETAAFTVEAPFPGVAWVTVEAEGILDSFTVKLDGNAGRFELPIKKEYAPNAWVAVYLLRPGGKESLPAERFGATRINVRRPDLELTVTPTPARKTVQPKEEIAGEIVVASEGHPVPGADVTVYAVDESYLDAGDWHEPALRQAMFRERFWGVSTRRGLEEMSLGVENASLHQKGFIIGGFGGKGGAQMNVKDLRTDFPPLAFWKTHLRTGNDGKVPFSFTAPDGLTRYRIIALAQTKQSQFGTGSDWVEIAKPVQIEPALPRFVRVGDRLELRAIVRQKIADSLSVKLRCTTDLRLDKPELTQTVARGIPTVFRFPATVLRDGPPAIDGSYPGATIRFETDAGSGDAVEMKIPVHSPTLLRTESVFAPFNAVRGKLPADWDKASGAVEVTVSSSPWLPKLMGLPVLLDYPHGCFEQITSRVLGYTVLSGFLAYLPEPAERAASWRKRVEAGIRKMNDGLTADGALPYWPGGDASPIPTIAGCWAARRAAQQGFTVPPRLLKRLGEAVHAIALKGGNDDESLGYPRAFALSVLSEFAVKKPYEPVLREMYLRREPFSDETRALLALAMHGFGIMPKEKQQILREIDAAPVKERAFDPETFSSTTRVEAMRALAFAAIDPAGNAGHAREAMRQRIAALLDTSESLSTQENFWLLLALRAMHPPPGPPANYRAADPVPAAISRNGASALWNGVDIRHIRDFAVRLDRPESLLCLMKARFRSDSPVTGRTDRGFRVERVVRNLTEASRTGAENAPFRLGDQIAITYRLMSPKLHHYVALEDELPAGLETVNPAIRSGARSYQPLEDKDARFLDLSHVERRDRTTCLYFNRIDPGMSVYTVLARATCAGVFHWPATQATPMYDSRFSGLSTSGMCAVGGE